jgi:hypothetical protein
MQPLETFRARAERIRMFELTADPYSRARAEGKIPGGADLDAGGDVQAHGLIHGFCLCVVLLDLCDQFDALGISQVEPE